VKTPLLKRRRPPRRTEAADRREEILREEMHRIAERGHRHFQWSVTLLLSLETALFFVRKEAAERAGFAPASRSQLTDTCGER
jgi:hypothetical protein